jgi:hypothetical protein
LSSSSSSSSQSNSVMISGGPAYPYNYQFQQLVRHSTIKIEKLKFRKCFSFSILVT